MASVTVLGWGWAAYLGLLQLRLEALAVEEGGLGPRHRRLHSQQAWAQKCRAEQHTPHKAAIRQPGKTGAYGAAVQSCLGAT